MIRLIVPFAVLATLVACAKAEKPEAPANPATTSPATAGTPAAGTYKLNMADLMTLAIQPRHTRIGLGGAARNWVYAAYEVKELNNAFHRIGQATPVFRDNDVAQMLDGIIKPGVDALDAAIKAKDGAAFDAAYVKLTDGCNECHTQLGQGNVVIRPVKGEAFPDQDFSAPEK